MINDNLKTQEFTRFQATKRSGAKQTGDGSVAGQQIRHRTRLFLLPYCVFPGIYFHTPDDHPGYRVHSPDRKGPKGSKISLSRFRLLIWERKPFPGDLYFNLLASTVSPGQPWLSDV